MQKSSENSLFRMIGWDLGCDGLQNQDLGLLGLVCVYLGFLDYLGFQKCRGNWGKIGEGRKGEKKIRKRKKR